ncbi:MAG: hypothetical protein H6566_17000 [Lewinellaceae bacterium]|nr:hypothetical protein [Lewinellaceae bacterium]
MTIVIKKASDKASIQKILGALSNPKKFDAYKYFGALRLPASPLDIQRALRDEWE